MLKGLNYSDILAIQRITEQAEKCGFMLSRSSHTWDDTGSSIGLKPSKDKLPIYARDAQFFTGDANDIQCFLYGVEWAKRYYEHLKLVSDKKVKDKEDAYMRNKLFEKLKGKDDSEQDELANDLEGK